MFRDLDDEKFDDFDLFLPSKRFVLKVKKHNFELISEWNILIFPYKQCFSTDACLKCRENFIN